MRSRVFVTVLGLAVMLIVGGKCIAEEGQTIANSDQPLQTSDPSSENSDSQPVTSVVALVAQLNLKMYEAVDADESVCKGDTACLYYAKQIRSWRCVAGVCKGEAAGGMEPATCFEGYADKYAVGFLAKINQLICPVVNAPSKETRQAFSNHVTDASEASLVENGAYVLALNGNAQACQDFIRNYVGPYGPNWNFKWYRAMSGCRILAGESTVDKEEQDFSTWYEVERGLAKCSAIMNSALRDACNTPKAASPKAIPEHVPGAVPSESPSNKVVVDLLQLRSYKAIADDLSQCGGDETCLAQAKEFKNWVCASKACAATDGKSQKPLDCFQDVATDLSAEKKDQIGVPLCAMLKSPTPETRKAFLALAPLEEENLVEAGAYLLALNGSAESCQAYIKDYFGAYGPNWQLWWYRALSGCRILAGESTPQQEERDFSTWLAVQQGSSNCSAIVNSELKAACNTPGAIFQEPKYEK